MGKVSCASRTGGCVAEATGVLAAGWRVMEADNNTDNRQMERPVGKLLFEPEAGAVLLFGEEAAACSSRLFLASFSRPIAVALASTAIMVRGMVKMEMVSKRGKEECGQ